MSRRHPDREKFTRSGEPDSTIDRIEREELRKTMKRYHERSEAAKWWSSLWPVLLFLFAVAYSVMVGMSGGGDEMWTTYR